MSGAIGLGLLLISSGLATSSFAAQPERLTPRLPQVMSASVPFYPAAPRKVGIEGDVRLSVTTDGTRATTIKVLSGHAMLVPASVEIVRTWQFKPADPTTFETTFRYRLLPEAECYFDSGTVLLHLPDLVEITAKHVMTCDPSSTLPDADKK